MSKRLSRGPDGSKHGSTIQRLKYAGVLTLLFVLAAIGASFTSNLGTVVYASLTGAESFAPEPVDTRFSEASQYTQGFETNDIWGDPPTDPNRVASGTNGVPSRTGGFHAEAVAGDFTRWGGYSSTFPADGFTTSISVYLNMAGGYANDTRFDYTSAINNPGGTHRRDFIFNGGFYNDGGPYGSGNRFVFSASNNSPGNPRDPGRNPVSVNATGWYTLKHRFYNKGNNALAVRMDLLDPSNTVVGTWVLSDPTDIIGSTVGGNRYGWFATMAFPFLAIDDTARANIVNDPAILVKAESLNGWAYNNSGTGAGVTFELGPGTPPLGNGSARFTVGPTVGGPFSMIRTNAYAGTRLADITSLSYKTYGQSGGGGTQAPVLSIRVDRDNNGSNDDVLYFEPVYQNGTYSGTPVPNQCGVNPNCVTYGQWQSWNALIGGFWLSPVGGPPLTTIAAYVATYPNAVISGDAPSVRFFAGGGSPPWTNYVGNVDDFVIGIQGDNDRYDFEPSFTTVVDDDGMGTATNCDASDVASTTLALAHAVAGPGDSTITVCPGTYVQTSTLNLNKPNITIVGAGPQKPVIQAPNAPTNLFLVTANGVTLGNLEIQKVDPHSPTEHNLIAVQGNNFTAQNNLIYGPTPGGTWSSVNLFSRAFAISAQTGTLITNNVIHTFRQPGYMSGGVGTGGTISNNTVSGTRGWVVEGGDYLFTGNTWGEPQNQGCDIALLGTIIPANQGFYLPLLALSTNNDNAFICQQFGALENGRAVGYVNDGAGAGGNGSDNANYQTITAGIAGTLAGGTVQVAAGNYNEDVLINKSVTLSGAGMEVTTISGPIGGDKNTVWIAASNVILEGFTITRDGNNTTDWFNPNMNDQGVNIGQLTTGNIVRNNRFTGNRNAVYYNNSKGNITRRNIIDFNRTGIQLNNDVSNTLIEENYITNNWTMGILFNSDTSTVDKTTGVTVRNNHIQGNWFGAVVSRYATTPAKLNVSGNWLGTVNPTRTTANSAELGYDTSPIPVEYGGAGAFAPGQPDLAGGDSGDLDYSPWLGSGADAQPGTPGFQGDFSSLFVNADSAQAAAGNPSSIQEAIDAISAGGSLNIAPGTYPGNVNVNKALTIQGIFTVGGSFTTSAPGVVVKPGTSPGIISTGNLSFGTGTNVDMELNGTIAGTQYDQFDVTGSVNIATTVNLNISVGYAPVSGHTYTIINNDGVDPVIGTFNGKPDDGVFFVGPHSFSIDYNGGDGNDVVITSLAAGPCETVAIPNNITSLSPGTVTVPVNVTSGTTGDGIRSMDFVVTYNASVVSYVTQTSAVMLAGTRFSGGDALATVNSATPGVLIVSVFQSAPITGSGSLINLTFNVSGAPGSSSPVSFSSFVFNEGSPCSTTTNGLISVLAGSISGKVTYETGISSNVPVQNTTLSATGSVNVSTTTDAAGNYTLTGLGAGAYTVTPSKVGNIGPGAATLIISGFDASDVAVHVAGLTQITDAQSLIAADVSGNGTITSFDAALIATYAAGLPDHGNSGTWRFVPVSRPYTAVQLQTNQTGQDYVAILMGDVTGNWGPNANPRPAMEGDPLVIAAPSVTAESGANVTIPVSVGDTTGLGIRSYQFDIRYDAAVLRPTAEAADLAGTVSEGRQVVVNATVPGVLTIVTYGATPLVGQGSLLKLNFEVIGSGDTSTELKWENFLLNEGGINFRADNGRVEVTASSDENTIRGKVVSPSGQPLRNVKVSVVDTTGAVRTAVTSSFGLFEFAGLDLGQTYIVKVDSKRYRFAPQQVSMAGSAVSLELMAQE